MDLIIEILLIVDPEVLLLSSTPLLPKVTTTATIPKPTTTVVMSSSIVPSTQVPVTTTTMERYTLSSDGPKNILPSIFVLVFAFILQMVFF